MTAAQTTNKRVPLDLTGTPPHSLEAEQVILGSLLVAPALLPDVVRIAPPEAWHEPRHQTILTTLQTMQAEGAPMEAAGLVICLRDQGELDKVGGPEYIVHLYRNASPHNSMHYAEVITEKHTKRQVRALAVKLHGEAEDGTGHSTKSLLDSARATIDSLYTDTTGDDGAVSIGDGFSDWVDRIQSGAAGPICGTPWPDLSRHLMGGFRRGQVVLIAGRPGSGKTTLAMNLAVDIAFEQAAHLPGLVVSQEMSRDELIARAVSSRTNIPLSKVKAGDLSETEWTRIAKHSDAFACAPLYVDDAEQQTVSRVRAAAMKIRRDHGDLGFIVVDHIGLMRDEHGGKSLREETVHLSRGMKALAKELDCVLIVLAQLNRGPESREDGKPRVSDLAESGALEQDADIVLLVHRPDQYLTIDSPKVDTDIFGRGDIIIGKHRDGEQTTVPLNFRGDLSKFTNRTHR